MAFSLSRNKEKSLPAAWNFLAHFCLSPPPYKMPALPLEQCRMGRPHRIYKSIERWSFIPSFKNEPHHLCMYVFCMYRKHFVSQFCLLGYFYMYVLQIIFYSGAVSMTRLIYIRYKVMFMQIIFIIFQKYKLLSFNFKRNYFNSLIFKFLFLLLLFYFC